MHPDKKEDLTDEQFERLLNIESMTSLLLEALAVAEIGFKNPIDRKTYNEALYGVSREYTVERSFGFWDDTGLPENPPRLLDRSVGDESRAGLALIVSGCVDVLKLKVRDADTDECGAGLLPKGWAAWITGGHN